MASISVSTATLNEPMRAADCVSFNKIVQVPATASGISTNSYLVSGGILVELGDGIGSTSWTPNKIEVTFLPVSSSIYDTTLAGYSKTGYALVHPWESSMTFSSTYYGLHPANTLSVGAGAYGKLCLLGQKIDWNFTADNYVNQIRIFNHFGGAVVAFINYTFQKVVTSETGTCGR
jgi:hypothetical protein